MPADRYTRWSQIHKGAQAEVRCGDRWLAAEVTYVEEGQFISVRPEGYGVVWYVKDLSDIRPLPEPRS